jgi:hypothetical protein
MTTIRDRLTEERKNYEIMSDTDLAFEAASLAENIESIQLELRLHQEGETERPRGWQPRAERAVTVLKGRAKLCKIEIDRRKRYDAERQDEQRRAEQEQRQVQREQRLAAHQEFLREAQQRKEARIQTTNDRELEKAKRFVRHAGRMLPRDTFVAIWTAVSAEGDE